MADPGRITIRFPDVSALRDALIRHGFLPPESKEHTMTDPRPLNLEQLVSDIREAESDRASAQAEAYETIAVLLGLDDGLARIVAILDAEARMSPDVGRAVGVAVGLRSVVRAMRRTLDEPDS